jgi:hypothetical protein
VSAVNVESEKALPMVGCRGMCGAQVPDEDAAMKAGWSYLQITKGWRCGTCERELAAANSIVGQDEGTADTLAPHDRGALPKETASTILAPSVPRNVSNR